MHQLIKRQRGRTLLVTGAAAIGLALATLAPAAASPTTSARGASSVGDPTMVAEAQPSECFTGMGMEPLPIGDHGTCPSGGEPRTTSQYLWGVTKDSTEKNIWFGTSTNPGCTGPATLASSFEAVGLGAPTTPYDDPNGNACEFQTSWAAQHRELPGRDTIMGDMRPAQILQYNIATKKVIDRSPDLTVAPDFRKLAGIRAAGALNDTVILGGIESAVGQGPNGGGTVVLEAYQASTGKWLAEKRFPEYNNVKNFFATPDNTQLFVGMALTVPEQTNGHPETGAVLRWTPTDTDPLHFDTVGFTRNQPAYFADYDNRLVASTWTGSNSGVAAGIEVSPPFHGDTMLDTSDIGKWHDTWGLNGILPDQVTAESFDMFKCVPFQDWLYCGAGIPSAATSFINHMHAYPDMMPDKTLSAFLNAYNKSSPGALVFRMKDVASAHPTVDLLYGEEYYWDYLEGTGWVQEPNNLSQKPRYGTSGFGDPLNDYAAWGADVFQGKLYMGTFNNTQVMKRVTLNPITNTLSAILGYQVPASELDAINSTLFPPGTDTAGQVWVFPDANSPATPLTLNGFGNADTWGIRGIIPVQDKTLFFGTNGGWQFQDKLASDAPNRPGWQLLEMTP